MCWNRLKDQRGFEFITILNFEIKERKQTLKNKIYMFYNKCKQDLMQTDLQ